MGRLHPSVRAVAVMGCLGRLLSGPSELRGPSGPSGLAVSAHGPSGPSGSGRTAPWPSGPSWALAAVCSLPSGLSGPFGLWPFGQSGPSD
eukprot:6206062-Pyramimonas_sp.AAC.1